jgi:hypothetical protein
MATFRNNQIEEILNDERKLNRTIMDRQKQHVSAIGDQRAPPTMRDIKIEAILGTQIDQLKEEINKAIQLISGFQFNKLDEKKIDRLLKMETRNQAAVPVEASQPVINSGAVPPTSSDPIFTTTEANTNNVVNQPANSFEELDEDETSGERDGVPGQPPP